MRAKISRRTLLKGLVAAMASTISMAPSRKSSAHDFQGYETNRGVLVDVSRCVGCRSCEVACSREHGLAPPPGLVDNYRASRAGLSRSERLLRRIWQVSRSPLVARCVALLPFGLKQSFKRRLSSRPMHDIVHKE